MWYQHQCAEDVDFTSQINRSDAASLHRDAGILGMSVAKSLGDIIWGARTGTSQMTVARTRQCTPCTMVFSSIRVNSTSSTDGDCIWVEPCEWERWSLIFRRQIDAVGQ